MVCVSHGCCVTGPLCHRAVVSQAHCMVCVSHGCCVTGPLCHSSSMCHMAVVSQQFYVSQGRCVTGPLCHRHTVWSVCYMAVVS